MKSLIVFRGIIFICCTLFSFQVLCEDNSLKGLLDQLDSKNNATVARAVYKLGKHGDKAMPAYPKLIELLDSETHVLRWAWGPKDNFVVDIRYAKGYNSISIARLAVDALAKLPGDSESLLKQIKQSKSLKFKTNGLRVIGKWLDRDVKAGHTVSKDISGYILKMLNENISEQGDLFYAAAYAAGKAKNIKTATEIMDLYNKQSKIKPKLWEYRQTHLIRTLGDLGYKKATPLLLGELSNIDAYIQESGWRVASAVIAALDKIQDPSSKDSITKFLERFDYYVTVDALSTYSGELDEPLQSSLISETYESRWLDIHKQTISLAGKLKASKAIPVLVSLLARREVRKTSAYALVNIDNLSAVDPLIRLIAMTRSDVNELQLEKLRKEQSLTKFERLLEYVRDYEPPYMGQMPIGVSDSVEKKRLKHNRPKPPGKVPADMMEYEKYRAGPVILKGTR